MARTATGIACTGGFLVLGSVIGVTSKMQDQDRKMLLRDRAYGIIFCGPPGKFSVWTLTPTGRLMDRETVELLGQAAVRYGAVDYRSFSLSGWFEAKEDTGNREYVQPSDVTDLERVVSDASGVPDSCGPSPSALSG